MLTELEKKIVAAIQDDISIVKRPYREIARKIGIQEEILLSELKKLCDKGVIRRFGATIRHQKSGFEANAMVAWQVDESRIDEAGEKMAAFKEVTHCYQRRPTDEWPYNLYTMIHGTDEESCRETARILSEQTGVDDYTLLFSRRELKKTSMAYFPMDDES